MAITPSATDGFLPQDFGGGPQRAPSYGQGFSQLPSQAGSVGGNGFLDMPQSAAAGMPSAAILAMETGRSLERDSGFFATSEIRGGGGGGGGAGVGGFAGYGDPGGDVDVTVMAYAQWLSEMKQQATSARYQQQAELDLMRDAINANNGELVDFKRHSSQVVHQLQGQVTELRARLADAFAEMAQQTRLRTEGDQKVGNVLNGLQQAVSSRQNDHESSGQKFADQLDRVRQEVDVKIGSLDGDMANLKRAQGNSQDQVLGKFMELDKAMQIFHGNITGTKQELGDTREDWKKSQDLLGQAISTLSQDLADFQKHASTVMNKLQSDAYHFEEVGRDGKDRSNRLEAQLNGIQQSVYQTTNEVILMKGGSEATAERRAEAFSSAGQQRGGQQQQQGRKRPSPRQEQGIDGSAARFIDRNESSATLYDGAGAGSSASQGGPSPASVGLRPQAQGTRQSQAMPGSGSQSGSFRGPAPEASTGSSPRPQFPGGSNVIRPGVPGGSQPPSQQQSQQPSYRSGAGGSATPNYPQNAAPNFQREQTPPQGLRQPPGYG